MTVYLLLGAITLNYMTHIAKRPRHESRSRYSGGACQRVSKLSILKCTNVSNVDSFEHLVGESYLDDDTLLEIISTRDVEHKGITIAC